MQVPLLVQRVIDEVRSSPVGFFGSILGIASFFGTASNIDLPGSQPGNPYYTLGFTFLICVALQSAVAFISARLFHGSALFTLVMFAFFSTVALFFSIGFFTEVMISSIDRYDHIMAVPFAIAIIIVPVVVFIESLYVHRMPSDFGFVLFLYAFAIFMVDLQIFSYFVDSEFSRLRPIDIEGEGPLNQTPSPPEPAENLGH